MCALVSPAMTSEKSRRMQLSQVGCWLLRRTSLILLSILLLPAIGGYRIRLVQCPRILLHSVMHHGVCVHTNLLCGQGSCQKGYTKATEKATKWTGKQRANNDDMDDYNDDDDDDDRRASLFLTRTRTYYILHTFFSHHFTFIQTTEPDRSEAISHREHFNRLLRVSLDDGNASQ